MDKVARFGLNSVADFLEAAVTHVTTKKPPRAKKTRAPRNPRVQRSTFYGSRTPRTVVVHVYSGAEVYPILRQQWAP